MATRPAVVPAKIDAKAMPTPMLKNPCWRWLVWMSLMSVLPWSCLVTVSSGPSVFRLASG